MAVKKGKNTGNIQSEANPSDDLSVVAKPADDKNIDNQKAKKEDLSFLHTFFLMELLNDANREYIRSAERQAQIDSALEYYQDQIDAANAEDREATIKAQSSSDYDPDITYRGTGYAGHRGRGGNSTAAFGDMGKIAIGEKQNRVNEVLADAAASAGVNIKTMQGMWHVETRFSSMREVSDTGCSGAWQFTRGTWAEMILKHGDEIAARLAAKGFDDDAAIALKYQQDLINKEIAVSDKGLQSQRFNQHIATYAAAYYMRDIAKRNDINAMDIKQGGKIYAAYNVGEGSLAKLLSLDKSGSLAGAMSVLGRVAHLNPKFYEGGATGSEALANYQAAVENGTKQYGRIFGSDPGKKLIASTPVNPDKDAPLAKVFAKKADVIHVPHPAASPMGMLASTAQAVSDRAQTVAGHAKDWMKQLVPFKNDGPGPRP